MKLKLEKESAGSYVITTPRDRYYLFHDSTGWAIVSEESGGTLAHRPTLTAARHYVEDRDYAAAVDSANLNREGAGREEGDN